MKRKLILGSCVCIVITIFNFENMLNVDDLKLELLFDKINTDHFPQASNAILQETNHIFVQNPFN